MPPFFPILAILMLISPLLVVYKTNKPSNESHEESLLVIITATWKSVTRIPDMFMLANTLAHEKDLFWLVVDNSTNHTEELAGIVERSKLPSIFLNIKASNNSNTSKIQLYNAGLNYIKKNVEELKKGYKKLIVYFAGLEYSYDTRLWNEYVRRVNKLGVWHVGRPYMKSTTTTDGFRYFDLANMAFNGDLLANSTVQFDENCKLSSVDLCFVRDLNVNKKDVQFFDNENTEDFLVWHAPKGYEPFLYQINLYNYLVEV